MKHLKTLLLIWLKGNSFALLLIGLAILAIPCEVISQALKYKIKNISVDDGLPQSSISDIIQDSEGYIWMTSEDGLIRYDGYEFKLYQHQPEDSTSIRGNFIYSISEDKEGYIWVIHGFQNDGLIDKFDKKTGRFIAVDNLDKVPFEIQEYFFNIKKTKKRKKGLFRELSQLYPHNITLNYQELDPILKDAAGNFWIRSAIGLTYIKKNLKPFHIIRNETNQPKVLGINNVRIISETNTGELLVGLSAPEFIHLQLNPLTLKNKLAIQGLCWAISKGRENTYWVGGGKGFSRWIMNYDPQTQKHYFLTSKIDWKSSFLSNSGIRSLAYESNGNLWIGSRSLWKYNEKTNGMDQIIDYSKTCSGANSIQIIPIKGKNEIWVGTGDCGIFRIQKKGNQYKTIKNYKANPYQKGSLSGNFINVIYPYNDSIFGLEPIIVDLIN